MKKTLYAIEGTEFQAKGLRSFGCGRNRPRHVYYNLFLGELKMLTNKKTKQNLAILLIAATVLGVTVLAWAKKPVRPDPTPPDPVIAYSNGGDLRVMDADGGNNQLVLRGAGFSVSLRPKWSPDGQKFTYFGYDRDLGRGIHTTNLDGSNKELLVVAQAQPFWSCGDVLGKGEKIVFSYPTDAQFIDYRADLGSEENSDIFIMNPDGTGLMHLVETLDLDEWGVAWSPDGQRLAVKVYTGVDQLYIYELGIDLAEITVVSITNIHAEAANAGVTLPTDLFGTIDWANSGGMLALSGRGDGAGTPSELFLVDLATYEKTQVITDSVFSSGSILGASFSPDDSKLAFSLRGADRKTEGIYSVNIDGTGLTKLAKADTALSPDWWVGSAPGELAKNTEQASTASPEFVTDEVLVAFWPGVGRSQAEAIHRGLGATEIKVFSQIGVHHWRLPPGLGVAQAVQVLSRNPNVRFAEANYILHIDKIPNDPRSGELWGLHNIGQTGGTPDADIDALEAWDIQTGSPGIVVGVIDTGIDYLHEDLTANIWVNPGETADNDIDDDGNGFIDDVMGWDFVNEDNDPMDDNGHGSHTAGTIGAVGDNGIGVAGVNWTVQLMPVKCFNSGGSGATDDIIEAILYAASFEDGFGNKIVRITNNSWGGGRRSKAMQDAIASCGALFVASAGNSASSRKQYPAGYDLENIISVAATDHNDELASFSNFGSDWVDLAAPGVDILSTIPLNKYGLKSGTSMAAPHVAGAAALLLAQFPDWYNDEIKTQILAKVDVLPSLEGKVASGGCLNARSALNGSEGPPDITAPAAVLDLAVTATTFDTVTLTWTATGDDGDIGTAYLYDVRYSTSAIITDADFDSAASVQGEPLPQVSGSLETFTVTGLSGDTEYNLALKVADEAGNLSGLSNEVFATTTSALPGAWQIETVASEGNVGFYNDHAYDLSDDGDGYPSIAYSDETNGLVKFAHWNGTSWDIEIVGGISNDNAGISLAYDNSGNPSMSYIERRGDLMFARRNGSSWEIEEVDRRLASRSDASLAYGADGYPSISYHMSSKGDIDMMFAHWNGTSWDIECVQAGGARGQISLAYDPDGNPAIAYGGKFAHWNGDSWDIQLFEPDFVYYTSLAYDLTTGYPTVVYRIGNIIRFAWWNGTYGTPWVIETVDSGTNGSHAFNSAGIPFISYYDYSGVPNVLKVARGIWDDDAEIWLWDIEIVDVDLANDISIAFDTTGSPSVSYGYWLYDGGEWFRDLKFARKQP